MVTGNFTCENTISELWPFSMHNCCHRYTSVKTTVLLSLLDQVVVEFDWH